MTVRQLVNLDGGPVKCPQGCGGELSQEYSPDGIPRRIICSVCCPDGSPIAESDARVRILTGTENAIIEAIRDLPHGHVTVYVQDSLIVRWEVTESKKPRPQTPQRPPWPSDRLLLRHD